MQLLHRCCDLYAQVAVTNVSDDRGAMTRTPWMYVCSHTEPCLEQGPIKDASWMFHLQHYESARRQASRRILEPGQRIITIQCMSDGAKGEQCQVCTGACTLPGQCISIKPQQK